MTAKKDKKVSELNLEEKEEPPLSKEELMKYMNETCLRRCLVNVLDELFKMHPNLPKNPLRCIKQRFAYTEEAAIENKVALINVLRKMDQVTIENQ